MKLSDLIGQEIVADDTVLLGQGVKPVKYVITEAYPYYVRGVRVCENGAILTQCFNIGDLVVRGMVKARKVPYKSGYRFVGKYEGKV